VTNEMPRSRLFDLVLRTTLSVITEAQGSIFDVMLHQALNDIVKEDRRRAAAQDLGLPKASSSH
jgi:hypothetical protein